MSHRHLDFVAKFIWAQWRLTGLFGAHLKLIEAFVGQKNSNIVFGAQKISIKDHRAHRYH